MKVTSRDFHKGVVKLMVTSPDDYWFLTKIIEPGDLITGTAERKISVGDNSDKLAKKKFTATIEAEKLDYADPLRINGLIREAPDDMPRGVHQSLIVEIGTVLQIKKNFLGYHKDYLSEAEHTAQETVLALLFDRDHAIFALFEQQGHRILSELKGDVAKKAMVEAKHDNFFSLLAETLSSYVSRYKVETVILGSSDFWKDYLFNELPSEVKQLVQTVTISSVSDNGIKEILVSPRMKKLLEHDREAKETSLVDDLMKAIAKEHACYGFVETKKFVTEANISYLLVTETFLSASRQKDTFEELEHLMADVDRAGGKVHLLTTEQNIKKVDGLGGIAGVVRW
ncbi:MAG: pelota family protein [Candidatus Woesearchaeota archaeon]|nr:MAG: pelota family protein [Candidatus Woesearchaeota archaeon]